MPKLYYNVQCGEDFAQVARMESASYAAQQGGDLVGKRLNNCRIVLMAH